MEVTVRIPDDIATSLAADGRDIARRTLESFVLEELKSGRLTEPELCRMLGLDRLQLDGFLKEHGFYLDVALEDIERDVADIKAWLKK